jgi:ribosomal protein S18 acetylase RimI-like enzyme
MDDRIRHGTLADSEGIVALLRQFAADERGVRVDDSLAVQTIRGCIEDRGGDLLVAEEQGAIVGYLIVHWIPFPMLGGVEGYISELIVAGTSRNGGLGSRLMDRAEALAREKGVLRLMLNNRTSDESFQRAFYAKRGFRRRDEFANMVKLLR